MVERVTYFRRVALSTSLARAKLSKPEQTLTRRLLEKNPSFHHSNFKETLCIETGFRVGVEELFERAKHWIGDRSSR
jgi:hypothetical protein